MQHPSPPLLQTCLHHYVFTVIHRKLLNVLIVAGIVHWVQQKMYVYVCACVHVCVCCVCCVCVCVYVWRGKRKYVVFMHEGVCRVVVCVYQLGRSGPKSMG